MWKVAICWHSDAAVCRAHLGMRWNYTIPIGTEPSQAGPYFRPDHSDLPHRSIGRALWQQSFLFCICYHRFHFWATVCKTIRPVLSDRCAVCLSCLSVTLVCCGQMVGLIRMPLSIVAKRLGGWGCHLVQQPFPPTFWPTSLAWSPMSAVAEFLLFVVICVPVMYRLLSCINF